MVTLTEFTDAMHQYRFLMLLWTVACAFALAAHVVIGSFAVLGLVMFILAAATTTTAGVSCAYVIARDSMKA